MLASLTLHISQIISGYIIQNLGVRYTFGITALVFIPLFASIFVFVPETVYNRVLQSGAVDVVQKDDSSSLTNTSSNVEKSRPSTAFKLTVFRGRVSSKSFWREVIRPFPLMVYPAVIFSSLIYGSFFTWFVVLTVLSVPIYSSPPYNLNPAQIGLTNLPLLATGMLGSAISGWMVDKIARSMARKNGGIYEPEFRLTYVTDCHTEDVNQAFVTMGLIKAIMTFLATTSVNGLFEAWGASKFFYGVAGINLVICSFTIPMYIFGKRFRALVSPQEP